MLHVIHAPVSAFPELRDNIKSFIKPAALYEWPNLLWTLRNLELSRR
jgi:hypothetical protein